MHHEAVDRCVAQMQLLLDVSYIKDRIVRVIGNEKQTLCDFSGVR